jgi:flagellar basal body L-ring protein FlgH
MKTTFMSIAIALLILSGTVRSAQAGSIWTKKDTNSPDRYTDDVARKIGDILTITIYKSVI